ncbi:MAG: hypothetical protein HY286_19850 [Planctomycetes bacterium]|nr:hypothetical protein [Planctomycetota bacterium]
MNPSNRAVSNPSTITFTVPKFPFANSRIATIAAAEAVVEAVAMRVLVAKAEAAADDSSEIGAVREIPVSVCHPVLPRKSLA